MRGIEMLGLTAAMFLLPFAMHSVVQCFDGMHRLLGRQARSPFAGTHGLLGLIVGAALVGAWHVWLARLSYCVVLDGDGGGDQDGREHGRPETQISWGRILSRIIVPLFLLGFAVQFVYAVAARVVAPAPFITANTVTLDDDVRLEHVATSL